MASDRKVHGIILAGGEGKRLRPLTYYFQKCMIPIGCGQKPLLEYVIRLLEYHDIKDITLLVGYKHEQIMNYFDKGERFGVRLDYLKDDPDLKGNGASLLNAYRQGLIRPGETLLIYYGDILSNIDLDEMLQQHFQEKSAATLAITNGYRVSVGVAEVNEKRVIGWVEKPYLNINAGIGILVLESNVIERLLGIIGDKECDIMGDIISHLIKTGEQVGCYCTDAFWYDVGSIELYEKLDNGLVQKVLGNVLFNEQTV